MPDVQKRISIESSRQVQRADQGGKIKTYQQVIWFIYGKGPYELFFPMPDTSLDAIRAAIEAQTQHHLDTLGLF